MSGIIAVGYVDHYTVPQDTIYIVVELIPSRMLVPVYISDSYCTSPGLMFAVCLAARGCFEDKPSSPLSSHQ